MRARLNTRHYHSSFIDAKAAHCGLHGLYYGLYKQFPVTEDYLLMMRGGFFVIVLFLSTTCWLECSRLTRFKLVKLACHCQVVVTTCVGKWFQGRPGVKACCSDSDPEPVLIPSV